MIGLRRTVRVVVRFAIVGGELRISGTPYPWLPKTS